MNVNTIWNNVSRFFVTTAGSIWNFLPVHKQSWVVDGKKLFNLSYYVQNPNARFRFLAQLVIFFALLLVCAGVVVIKKRVKDYSPVRMRFLNKLIVYFLTFGLVGYLLLFFRLEDVKYLSTRFLLIISIIIYLIWGARIIWVYLRNLPILEREYEVTLLKQKYMPRRKRK